MLDPQFVDLLRKHLKYLRADEALPEEKPLKDLGLDSMASIDLLFDLEDTFGVMMPDHYLTENTFSTAHALWEAVSTLRSKNASDCR